MGNGRKTKKDDGARHGKKADGRLSKADYEDRLEPLRHSLIELARYLQHSGKRLVGN